MVSTKDKKDNHTGTVKKSVKVNASQDKTWRKISNIIGLPEWVLGVKKTVFLSKKRRGPGTIRKITFEDGNKVEEIVVGWKDKEYFSYIATSGLPLRAYHATISIKKIDRNMSTITWQSYFNSIEMTKAEFIEFVKFLEGFYQDSLKMLKTKLE